MKTRYWVQLTVITPRVKMSLGGGLLQRGFGGKSGEEGNLNNKNGWHAEVFALHENYCIDL
jgi:hypothetical protein